MGYYKELKRKYDKHVLNLARNDFVKNFDTILKHIVSTDTTNISADMKHDVTAFYQKAKEYFTDQSVQSLIDNKHEIRAYAGNILAKNGLIQLGKELRDKQYPPDEIKNMIAKISKAHTDIYVAFTPLEKGMHNLKKYESPKESADNSTESEGDSVEQKTGTSQP